MAEVLFLTAAREEFLAAAEHYETASPGLGEAFVGEVVRAVSRIQTFPDHGSPYVAGSRRIVLQCFPFDVVYLRAEEHVLVVAVAHQRRSPYYWRQRL